MEKDYDYEGIVVHNSSYPDVDLDFSDRDKVKDYLVSKYGYECVCSVGTVGRLKTKGVIQNLARVNNVPQEEYLDITAVEMGGVTAAELEEMDLEELENKFPKLNEFFKKYPKIKRDFNKLNGCINCWGKHAGGVILSNTPLTDIMPVRVIDGKLVSCWTEGLSGRELGEMGFIKMDLLGVNAMSVFFDTAKLIEERHGVKYDYYNTPINDRKAFGAINSKDNIGIYQFDSELSNKVVEDMGGVHSFDDLVSLTALIRPSALQNKFPKRFKEAKEFGCNLPKVIENDLKDTAGLPLFQEAAYLVARNMAKMNVVDASDFMKTLYKGKMTPEKVPFWKEKFLNGCDYVREVIEVELDNGEVKQFEEGEIVICKDGISRTIEEIIEKQIEI